MSTGTDFGHGAKVQTKIDVETNVRGKAITISKGAVGKVSQPPEWGTGQDVFGRWVDFGDGNGPVQIKIHDIKEISE